MFLHLYQTGYSRFRRLKEHYQEHGIFPRTHGNTKQVPSNVTSEKSLEAVLIIDIFKLSHIITKVTKASLWMET